MQITPIQSPLGAISRLGAFGQRTPKPAPSPALPTGTSITVTFPLGDTPSFPAFKRQLNRMSPLASTPPTLGPVTLFAEGTGDMAALRQRLNPILPHTAAHVVLSFPNFETWSHFSLSGMEGKGFAKALHLDPKRISTQNVVITEPGTVARYVQGGKQLAYGQSHGHHPMRLLLDTLPWTQAVLKPSDPPGRFFEEIRIEANGHRTRLDKKG